MTGAKARSYMSISDYTVSARLEIGGLSTREDCTCSRLLALVGRPSVLHSPASQPDLMFSNPQLISYLHKEHNCWMRYTIFDRL